MIRQATSADIAAIAATYEDLLTYEQKHGGDSHWELGVYPTIAVPKRAVPAGEMVVLEEDGEIRASMILNHAQPAEYADVAWRYPGEGEDVLVVHTLCVPPRFAGHGYGSRMVQYATEYAAGHGCAVVRLDTYAHNEPAKRL
ncbi:GNAT family N-acetyltransferase [Bifidobacterium sp.]|uniref:GNAT family N-acetyltransferase n=1 Tax=Bifidobacterium sp. TaxID=41200 RepID=UPI003D7E09EE